MKVKEFLMVLKTKTKSAVFFFDFMRNSEIDFFSFHLLISYCSTINKRKIYLISTEEDDLTFPADADEFLITFLRPCKFYPQSAFQKIQKYFKFSQKHKKVCDNITVDSVQNVFDDDLIKYLPLRDLEGRRILYLNCGSE